MLFTLFLVLVFFSLFFSRVAGNTHDTRLSPRHRRHARLSQNRYSNNITRRSAKTYALTDMYQGANFLNDWTFFTASDPTHGSVNFQSKEKAMAKGLAVVQDDGTTVLSVDDTSVLPIGAKRDSIRITTKKKYNGGLFIADFFAMPHGCSVWPAYWSVGPNWPASGEIDIIEGVHEQNTNHYTLHTSSGCTLSTGKELITSEVLGKKCFSSPNSNSGCGFQDTDTRTYGHPFNELAGGVFAHLWDSGGIRVWHFARGEIPDDISAKKPDPSLWAPPVAVWSASACDINSHFHDHSLILDTTLCGDFGTPTFASNCTGTCAEAVSNPDNFKFAKWKVNYIAVYN